MEHEQHEEDMVIVFDTLFTTSHIQQMKICLPLLPTKLQQKFAIYIKFQELIYTVSYFKKQSDSSPISGFTKNNSRDQIFSSLSKHCSESDKEKFTQMQSVMQAMDMYQNMKELFPDGMNLDEMDLASMMEGMGMDSSTMGNMDISSLFSAFSSASAPDTDSDACSDENPAAFSED